MWGFLVSRVAPFLGIVLNTLVGFAVGPLFRNIKKYWEYWLIAILLGGNLVFSSIVYKNHTALENAKAAHQLDIKKYRDAQAEAEDRAQEIKERLERENKERSDEADRNFASLNAQYRSSLMRYAALRSQSGGPSGGQQTGPAQSGNGPSGSAKLPDVLEVTLDDARICGVNTARLQAVRAWALTLAQ